MKDDALINLEIRRNLIVVTVPHKGSPLVDHILKTVHLTPIICIFSDIALLSVDLRRRTCSEKCVKMKNAYGTYLAVDDCL